MLNRPFNKSLTQKYSKANSCKNTLIQFAVDAIELLLCSLVTKALNKKSGNAILIKRERGGWRKSAIFNEIAANLKMHKLATFKAAIRFL